MRARSVEEGERGASRTRLLIALLTGATVILVLTACGGPAPATTTGQAISTVAPTTLATPTGTGVPGDVPTPVATTGPAEGQASGSIAWDVRQGPSRVSDVVSTGDLLVAVGTPGMTGDGSDIAGVWISPDGREWEPAEVERPAGTISAVAAGSGRLVAVGSVEDGVSRPAGWTSQDGRTWEALPRSAFAGSGRHEPGALEDVAAGSSGFVAVGSEVGPGGSRAAAWHSADGLTWTHTESKLGGDSAGSVVPSGSGFVAAGWDPLEDGDARALFWTSADGRTWTAAPDADDLHDVGSTPRLAAAGQHLVAFGGRAHSWGGTEATVWTSQDGITWQSQATSGVVAPLPTAIPLASGDPAIVGLRMGGLVGIDGGFVATGGAFPIGAAANAAGAPAARRVVWTSPTGASWTIAADLPAPPANAEPGPASIGPPVVHQGQLLVFGGGHGGESVPIWSTDLEAILDSGE